VVWLRHGRRDRTADTRTRRLLRSATGAVVGAVVDAARDGIKNVSQWFGTLAGAGIAYTANEVVERAGYHPHPMITVGAVYAGAKVGERAGKALNAGLDRIADGLETGPEGIVIAQLCAVLYTLEQVDRGMREVIDSINRAQAFFQKVSRGARNNLLTAATRRCHQAPNHILNGLSQVKQAQGLAGECLLVVAKTGRA